MTDDIFKFLDGSAPYEGVWLGQEHPVRRGAFWWRKPLKDALDGMAEAMRQVTAERNLLTVRIQRSTERNRELKLEVERLTARLDRLARVASLPDGR